MKQRCVPLEHEDVLNPRMNLELKRKCPSCPVLALNFLLFAIVNVYH